MGSTFFSLLHLPRLGGRLEKMKSGLFSSLVCPEKKSSFFNRRRGEDLWGERLRPPKENLRELGKRKGHKETTLHVLSHINLWIEGFRGGKKDINI